MKFLAITLIVHALRGARGDGSPRSRGGPGGSAPPDKTALLAEELGFDGFGVGERHERPFYGHDPADAVVGAGTAGYYATPRSQDAQQFGHSVLHLHADAGGLTDAQHRESLELFQSDIAPVLRREIPDPLWPAPAVLMEV
jgi:hypothetical protein